MVRRWVLSNVVSSEGLHEILREGVKPLRENYDLRKENVLEAGEGYILSV
ncbi:Hypothetical protein FKW44_024721 [Caligus rogercresseyi]|uniref:Uncharacterized protein n=1 Tax=Caligus rogercresseyi TaxID=217165 RepID=A0A7T8GMG2_CALRO|nr:Hypothetical protein FKW44_024721 [Caligus rogercresseyi]